ncbi:aminopeptidase [Ovoidimarina sediminis]|uniref:aminopeptidase n=1 Tax=Ovoidimarina sediminis TaxID=3079856 RepID=UPI002913C762|nr:aminopeptidase [Rhodophyticola sp. MJ-SS7]MDU8945389.1 aminopeptidase [Rhodophyticola sp. MJ-SS7]
MTFTTHTIDREKLKRLADVAVKVGLNLQPGQELVMTAPVEALPLVREITEAAYEAGASLVTPLLSDDEVTLARYRSGTSDGFDTAPGWLYEGMAQAFEKGAARLAIKGDDPALLAGRNPDHVGRAAKAMSAASRPALNHIANFRINWNIVSWPGLAWARQVFPHLAPEAAQAALADAIFKASRVDQGGAVEAWRAHNATLAERAAWLNGNRFDALHYTGPGTDLTIGLADGHAWVGGETEARNGVICTPNIPTEEVFTTPHAERADGYVRATKPLSYQGTLIEEIEVRFEGGRITEARAASGENVFRTLLDNDEGARRLGEVALVPHRSPISDTGLLFYNTLFDENAASHIALGQCYAECFEDKTLSKEEVAQRGGNSSIIHVDWMIGSAEIDIDGITADGTRVPVMRSGGWAQG